MTKKHTPNYLKFLAIGFSMLGVIACSLTSIENSNPESVTATNIEIPTAAPSATSIPATEVPTALSIPVLTTREIHEEVDSPKYILEISYPFLENGGTSGEVFNGEIQSKIDAQISSFIQSAEEVETWRKENMPDAASGLYINHTITNATHNLISVKLDISAYIAGAAHPNPYSVVYNFDLATGKQLSLEDLFQPGSDYLQKISEYCINELQNNEYVFPDFQQNAEPTTENYQNWNLQKNSLLITFDVYQIAPYAAGPQMIEVPYEILREQIGSQSPLSTFLN